VISFVLEAAPGWALDGMPPLRADEVPQGCRLALVSPYDVRFSQFRIRAEFQDGRPLEEAQALVEVRPRAGAEAPAAAEAPPQGEGPEDDALTGDLEDLSAERGEEFDLLWAPFPQIEVTRWRCKLREADGSPRTDPDTGLELYASEERWFAFDNRRLCCLQRAAAQHWPREVRMCVVVVPPALARTRELRKFDTTTSGSSISIGRRDDPDPVAWCWRTQVGLPPEEQLEEGVAREKCSRFRGPRGSAGRPQGAEDWPRSNPRGRGRRGQYYEEEEDDEGSSPDVFRSAMLFLLVYLGLRLVVSVVRKTHPAAFGTDGAGPLDGVVAKLLGGLIGGQK